MDEAVPPAGGVIGLVPNTIVIPLGAPDVARLTADEKAPID